MFVHPGKLLVQLKTAVKFVSLVVLEAYVQLPKVAEILVAMISLAPSGSITEPLTVKLWPAKASVNP